jgi:hypothetical protein
MSDKRTVPMAVKKALDAPIKRYHCLEGDSVEYCETGKAKCANDKCTSGKPRMTLIAAVYQYGMFEDFCTEVHRCKTCLENTAFRYETKVSLVDNVE